MSGSGGAAAPTGCYKCGRPGHWSRDCPSNPNSENTSIPNSNPNSNANTTSFRPKPPVPAEKPKTAPRTRPKLTPELLLSDTGIGNVLKHFPRAIKCRGRGHEVDDLRHLLGLYAEWHSHLLPYYSFDQFVNKVEQVGTTKRVKLCLRSLQERVADGADPSKLHEPETTKDSNNEQDAQEDMEMPNLFPENDSLDKDTADFQEDAPHCSWETAIGETPQPLHVENDKDMSNQTPSSSSVINSNTQSGISDEQKARMETKKLKAEDKLRAAALARGVSKPSS